MCHIVSSWHGSTRIQWLLQPMVNYGQPTMPDAKGSLSSLLVENAIKVEVVPSVTLDPQVGSENQHFGTDSGQRMTAALE